MQTHADLLLLVANDRIRSEVAAAARARLAQPAGRPSLRRSVGHRIIRLGERLAEEPHLQPARPR